MVCSPKDHGGLGLPDLRTLGYALRLRWEWKRRTDPSVAWAPLPLDETVDHLLIVCVCIVQVEAACALCNQHDETDDHLLIVCVFSRDVWSRLLMRVGLLRLNPLGDSALQDWWISSRKQIPHRFRRAFDSVVIFVSWNVWKKRNDRTFNGRGRTTVQVCGAIFDEIRDCVTAGFNGLTVFAPDGAFG